jgi:hypothetical protein
MPETVHSTASICAVELCSAFFSYMYIFVKFDLQVRDSKRLTTAPNNKIEFKQYTVIKVIYNLQIIFSGNIHLIFSDCVRAQVTETMEAVTGSGDGGMSALISKNDMASA